MPEIRTTMTPTVPQIVTDAVADDLRAQGVLLEDTRATTDEGLTKAALRQVWERSLDPATRAGIAEADRRRAASSAKHPAAKKKSSPRRSARGAKPAAPPADIAARPAESSSDPAPAAVAPDTSGVAAPADSTTQES